MNKPLGFLFFVLAFAKHSVQKTFASLYVIDLLLRKTVTIPKYFQANECLTVLHSYVIETSLRSIIRKSIAEISLATAMATLVFKF